MNTDKRYSVLVVDDEPMNLGVLFETLKKSNFKVYLAQNGESVLKGLERIHPDIILMDVRMPGMDGFELCRRLKEINKEDGTPIIFLSALAEKSDIVKGLDLDAVDYITKPFNPDEVISRIRRHLEISDLQKQLENKNRQLKKEIFERRRVEEKLLKRSQALEIALNRVKTLSGLLPICSHCKNVRNDEGYWEKIEHYIQSHSGVNFSHGICPDCCRTLYPPEKHPELYQSPDGAKKCNDKGFINDPEPGGH